MSHAIRGGCLCQEIRYEVRGEPLSVAYCHCTICRRASGASPVAWATISKASLVITRGQPARYQSSLLAKRSFCARCGSQLFFSYETGPDEIDVTVGSLDKPDLWKPTYHIFTKSRSAWAVLQDGLPQYEEDGPDVTPYHH